MYEENKGMKLYRRFTVFLFVVCVVANLVLIKWTGIFNIVTGAIWIYGLLNLMGIIKSVDSVEGNKITYNISIPIIPIAICRIAQVLLFQFTGLGTRGGERWFDLRFFVGLIVSDLILSVFAILQNSSYCYVGEMDEVIDVNSVEGGMQLEEEKEHGIY